MKKAIWGTGLYASEFLYAVKRENIDFFIDNDKRKKGQSYLGKKVLCPDDVEDWKDVYVYIPYNYYDEITKQLKEYGVSESQYQVYYEINKMDAAGFKEDYEQAISELRQHAEQMKGFCVFWGRCWAFAGKGYKEYIKKWQEADINLRLGVVSEAVWYTKEETEKILDLPTIVTPGVFDDNVYVEGGILDDEQTAFLKKRQSVWREVERLMLKFPDLSEESACYMIYHVYQYVTELLELVQPELIVIYARMMVQHKIVEEVCREKGIPLISTHQGILAGTFSFEVDGEVGKSLLAIHPQKFRELPVSEADLEHAKKVWTYLYDSKLNRKLQPKNNCIQYIMERIDKRKPIIFFAAIDDVNADIVPYTEEIRTYHSPVFETSMEAGIYLAKVCEKNGWNFIYKPHPMRARNEQKELLPDNTIYIEYGNINDIVDISDVVLTILSQTNYVSLIRNKPVVMLGYNHIKGKGCTYEAFEKNRIEESIKEALEYGFTMEQKKAFLVHIAQMLKYYLYDDMVEREVRFGREVPGSIDDFYKLKKLLIGTK